MRPSTAGSFLAAFLATLVLTAGCIGTSGEVATLQAEQGAEDVAIHLVIEDGRLVDSKAWWTSEPVETDTSTVPGLEAVVLKNDVELDRVPLTGDAQRAELTWYTGQVDAAAQPGDEFEVNALNATSGQALATYTVQIEG